MDIFHGANDKDTLMFCEVETYLKEGKCPPACMGIYGHWWGPRVL